MKIASVFALLLVTLHPLHEIVYVCVQSDALFTLKKNYFEVIDKNKVFFIKQALKLDYCNIKMARKNHHSFFGTTAITV